MIQPLLAAIVTKYNTITALTGIPLYFGQAPAGGPFPFVAYYINDGSIELTFNKQVAGVYDNQRFENFDLQFKVRGTGANTIAGYLDSLLSAFDRTPLVVTGTTFLASRPLRQRLDQINATDGSSIPMTEGNVDFRFELST